MRLAEASTSLRRTNSESAALVAGAIAGDGRAFERLIAAYDSYVYKVAFTFTKTDSDARDLAQESLLNAFRSIGSFRGQSSFSTWLHAIVRNVFLDGLKSRSSRQRANEVMLGAELHPLSDAPGAEERLIAHDARLGLLRALQCVSAPYRTVVLLSDVKGLSHEEIVQALQVPMGTVKSRLKRGRAALLRILKRQPQD